MNAVQQEDEMMRLIRTWDRPYPGNDENTILVILLREMRKRIILLEQRLEASEELLGVQL